MSRMFRVLSLVMVLCFTYNNVSSQMHLDNGNYIFSYPIKVNQKKINFNLLTNCYFPQRNWFQAFSDCKNQNQDLVVIPDEQKLIEVQNLIDDLQLTSNFDDWDYGIWIDGADLGDEGKFIWMTTGKELDKNSIELVKRSGFIDSLYPGGSTGENCMTIVRKNGTQFVFNDAPCSPHSIYYLCEKAIKVNLMKDLVGKVNLN